MEKILKYLKAFAYILVPFLIFIVLTTVLNYFNIIRDDSTKYLKLLTPLISMFIGGIYLGKKSKEKGWLEGLKIGSIFILFLFLLSYLGFDKGPDLRLLFYYIILLFCSMLGSMIGISKKENKK